MLYPFPVCNGNFNALPHALPYIFFQFSLVWDYLQHVTITSTCYHTRYCTISLNLAWFKTICNVLPRVTVKFIKNAYQYFFKNIDGNAWQPVADSPKPSKSQKKYMVTRVVTGVVTCLSFGNALHYGLSMFVEFEKLPYSSVISI